MQSSVPLKHDLFQIYIRVNILHEGDNKDKKLLPGQPSATELQKIILMSTAYSIRKVLE